MTENAERNKHAGKVPMTDINVESSSPLSVVGVHGRVFSLGESLSVIEICGHKKKYNIRPKRKIEIIIKKYFQVRKL